MMARGFQPVGWVAAVGGAALGCYMLSLNVASERAELAALERNIIIAKQDIRSLQTELGTRGRMSQLEAWNADILALSAPSSGQYLKDEMMLARFDQREKTIEEKAKVQLASAEIKPKPAPVIAQADYAAAAAVTAAESTPTVHRASLVADAKPLVRKASLETIEAAPLPARKQPAATSKPKLLADALVAEIGAAARAEKKGAVASKGQ